MKSTYNVSSGPRRIVCLTEEPTEILYELGEADRIVGISAYTVRPPEARRDKPIVSAFVDGSVEKIRALEPDLVVGFSDVQAELARKLILANLPVLIFNQRSVQEILDVVIAVGGLVGARERAERLVRGYVERLDAARARAEARATRPRVYFEEWDEPMLCGSAWVSEIIEIAGGHDVFAERAHAPKASDRQVSLDELIASRPEIMLASWCGKPFDIDAVRRRPGIETLPALENGHVEEIPAEIILQPGPASLTAGLERLEEILSRFE